MAPPCAIDTEPVTDTETMLFSKPLTRTIVDGAPKNGSIEAEPPLTVENVGARRARAGRLVAGVAAPASSDMFKGRAHVDKPKAKSWDHRLSTESLSRKGNSLKSATKYLKTPGLISLGGGLPSSEYFPYDEMSFKVPTIGAFTPQETSERGATISSGKHDMAEGSSIFDISTAFNYGMGTGSAQLLRWVTEHTEIVHNPPYQDWQCNLTVGSTSALDMALRMFAERGDYMMTEEYTFATAVETAAPMGVKTLGIAMDDQGLLPSDLDHLLSTWDTGSRRARKPFLLYTVPSGQNPTGATQSATRRREIYVVAQKHDLFILEDEPYYFLQMQPYTGANAPDAPPPSSHSEFLSSLVPSLLSMDTDGRVMRLDSFSKVIAPGSRVGWITASAQLCNRYYNHVDVCTQGPSGISQLTLFKLLDEHWGHAGYLDWLIHIRLSYTRRRDVMLAACERHLPREVVSWSPPAAGMFHWLRIAHEKHPDYRAGKLSLIELEEKIFLTVIETGALIMRGSWFRADAESELKTLFFRATYAAAESGKIEEAIRRVGVAMREEFGLVQGRG